jgi:hypothetical protein
MAVLAPVSGLRAQLPDSLELRVGDHGLRAQEGERLTLWHGAGDSARARLFLDFLDDQRPLPGLPPDVPSAVRAVLAPDRQVFDSLLGGRVPEWSGGVAVPDLSLLVIPGYQGSLTRPGEAARVLRHEWAHLGLHQYLDGLRVPRWFSEGYAEWAAGWTPVEAWRLRLLLASGGAPALDSLALRWPSGSREARSAYLLSATVLEYLVDASGERGIRVLLERWREGGSFERALRSTYGLTSGQLEEDWREWVEGRYGWLYVLSHSAVFWAFLSLLLIVMVFIRRRERQQRMEELADGEPPDRPAFWLGEEWVAEVMGPRSPGPDARPPDVPGRGSEGEGEPPDASGPR